jgi:hypothetical protein
MQLKWNKETVRRSAIMGIHPDMQPAPLWWLGEKGDAVMLYTRPFELSSGIRQAGKFSPSGERRIWATEA